MNSIKLIKIIILGSLVAVGLLLMSSSSLSMPAEADDKNAPPRAAEKHSPEEFVGSETCKTCHEDQFNSFSKTAHAKLAHAGWKTERQGCESCHGPGKAHVEGGGDKTKIRTFAGETPKQKSEACLACHAGKEEHNNYRRGEHWRNDVGCTDCHSAHFSTRKSDTVAGLFDRKDAPSS